MTSEPLSRSIVSPARDGHRRAFSEDDKCRIVAEATRPGAIVSAVVRHYSMSRSGNVWDNAAMESFFSSLKAKRTAHKVYRTREDARADVFDYIERFYNPRRRHSTLGYMSPSSSRKKLCWLNLASENRQQATQLKVRLASFCKLRC